MVGVLGAEEGIEGELVEAATTAKPTTAVPTSEITLGGASWHFKKFKNCKVGLRRKERRLSVTLFPLVRKKSSPILSLYAEVTLRSRAVRNSNSFRFFRLGATDAVLPRSSFNLFLVGLGPGDLGATAAAEGLECGVLIRGVGVLGELLGEGRGEGGP